MSEAKKITVARYDVGAGKSCVHETEVSEFDFIRVHFESGAYIDIRINSSWGHLEANYCSRIHGQELCVRPISGNVVALVERKAT